MIVVLLTLSALTGLSAARAPANPAPVGDSCLNGKVFHAVDASTSSDAAARHNLTQAYTGNVVVSVGFEKIGATVNEGLKVGNSDDDLIAYLGTRPGYSNWHYLEYGTLQWHDTGVAIGAGEHNLTIVVDTTAQTVEFYVDGSEVGSLTSSRATDVYFVVLATGGGPDDTSENWFDNVVVRVDGATVFSDDFEDGTWSDNWFHYQTGGAPPDGVTFEVVDIDGGDEPGPPFTLPNAETPLSIPTYEGSGQAVHPSVLYFESGFAYHYIMAFTPYPNSNDDYENPSVIFSDDGINWTDDGVDNPLDIPPDNYHLCDPDIVWDGNEFKLYYLLANHSTSPYTYTLKLLTSADGVNWSGPYDIFVEQGIVSPAVIYDEEEGKYKMWYVNHSATHRTIWYRESVDGWNWSSEIQVNFTAQGLEPWHPEVVKLSSGLYLMLIAMYPSGSTSIHNQLYVATSWDGLNWKVYDSAPVLAKGPSGSWDDGQIYRSSFIVQGSVLYVWYSAMNSNHRWGIGFTSCDISDFLNAQLHILEPDYGEWVAGTFTVTWEPVDGADHYSVYLDDLLQGNTTDTTFDVTASDGSHAVTVRAYDSSDTLIAEGSVDVNVDATAPTVSITSPSDGATLGPGTVTVTWDASDSGSGISTIKVYLDGGLEATLGPGNASYDLDLSAGDHTIEVKVYDSVGNVGSDAVSVTVSGEISVTITSPSEGDYVATGDVTVTWTYSGTVDHFGVSVDGGSEQDVGTSTSVTLTLDDGQHTVTVTAHGSATASDSVTFTVDTTPPSLSVSAPQYATGDYEVTWTCAEDNLDHYEVSVDGGAWQNVGTSASYTVTDPTEGSHTVAVKAVDKAGNEATQTVTTTVDATPPSLTITSPEDDSVIVGHSVTLEWSVSDSGSGIDYVGYRVGTGAWTEVTGATQVVLTLDDGYYTITMKAVDNAGNEVYRAVSFTVVDPIQLTITSPEENATLEPGNITVTWEVNGTVDHFAVRLDDGPWIDVGNATSWTFTDVTEGNHTVYVRAYENETAYVEESVTFTIAASGSGGGSWWDNWDTDDVGAWIEDHLVWILVMVVVVLLVLVGRRW